MSSRLRLTVVTHYFAEHGGGIERVASRLCEDLAARHGHSVRWFASRTDPQTSNDRSLVERVAMPCWNGIERLAGLPYPLWGVQGLRALARAIAVSDAVQVHDFSYFGSMAAARIARSHRVPLLLTQHTGAVRTGSRAFAALYGVGERTIGRWLFATAAAVTCVSETTRAHWQPMVRDGTTLQTVWNGLDFDDAY
ncbi:MAG: glycosyltransferase, partial [Gammaproteobacteria bacterium]|nr:glycosyltransferase [Gammaproteobacteria bacterium]